LTITRTYLPVCQKSAVLHAHSRLAFREGAVTVVSPCGHAAMTATLRWRFLRCDTGSGSLACCSADCCTVGVLQHCSKRCSCIAVSSWWRRCRHSGGMLHCYMAQHCVLQWDIGYYSVVHWRHNNVMSADMLTYIASENRAWRKSATYYVLLSTTGLPCVHVDV
jgi:hypothetical protein